MIHRDRAEAVFCWLNWCVVKFMAPFLEWKLQAPISLLFDK